MSKTTEELAMQSRDATEQLRNYPATGVAAVDDLKELICQMLDYLANHHGAPISGIPPMDSATQALIASVGIELTDALGLALVLREVGAQSKPVTED